MGDQLRDAKPFGLTQRQIEVLVAVARARNNREAAAALGLSEATVKHHLANIYERMGVLSRTRCATSVSRRSNVAKAGTPWSYTKRASDFTKAWKTTQGKPSP